MNIRKLYRRANVSQRGLIRKFWGYWLKWGLIIFGVLWIVTALIELATRHK